MKKKSQKKNYASVTVTMVRDRKIWTTLRTNQIARFVTVLAWEKINGNIVCFSEVSRVWNIRTVAS